MVGQDLVDPVDEGKGGDRRKYAGIGRPDHHGVEPFQRINDSGAGGSDLGYVRRSYREILFIGQDPAFGSPVQGALRQECGGIAQGVRVIVLVFQKNNMLRFLGRQSCSQEEHGQGKENMFHGESRLGDFCKDKVNS